MTPAGWYVDPEGSGQLRWWDGTAWTQHRQSPAQMQQAPVQPSMLQPMQPSMQQGPMQQPSMQQPSMQQGPMPRTVIQPGQMDAPHHDGRAQFGAIGTTIPNSESPPQSPLFIMVWVGLIGMAIGPFLDWLKLDAGFAEAGVKGTESYADGEFWVISSIPDGYVMLAIAALVLVAAIVYNGKDSRGAAGWIAVLGIIGLVWAAASFVAFKAKLDDRGVADAFDLQPAIGMWVAGIGAVLVIVGGLATKATASKATDPHSFLQ